MSSRRRTEPVPDRDRIRSLDVLRGFALLGILVVNIQGFSMPAAAYLNPTVYGNLTGADLLAWWLTHVLFDQKFISIFSMLFGAGMVLFAERANAKHVSAKVIHYRRMAVLLVFGLVHAHLIWFGDILVSYALCGMILFPLRKRSARTLLVLGVVWIAIGSLLYLISGLSMASWPAKELEQFTRENWLPTPAMLTRELAAYRGGWLEQLPVRSQSAFVLETLVFALFFFWKAGGMMLLGMGLQKLGVLEGRAPRHVYGILISTGLFVGLPLVAYGAYANFRNGWDIRYSFFFGSQFNLWGSVLVALAYVSAVILLVKSGRLKDFVSRLEALGRTAFSNYILQSLICTTVFYGHGFGKFGNVERSEQMLLVLGIWVLQLTIAPMWLQHFRYGPLEWLWRALTYGKRPAFRARNA